jgi:exopolysaccharide biosynthesis polyprenyl glycosylphosphotransferase
MIGPDPAWPAAVADRPVVKPPPEPGMPHRGAVIRRLEERLSGIAVLLVVADVLAAVGSGIAFSLTPLGIAMLLAVLLVCRTQARVYRRRLQLSYMDDFPRSITSVAAAFGIAVALYFYFNEVGPKDDDVLYAMLTFVALSELARLIVFVGCRIGRRRLRRGDRTLVVGADAVGADLAQKMADHPEFGLRPVGMTDLTDRARPGDPPVDLGSLIVEHRVGTVVLAHYDASAAETMAAAITASRLGCSILVLPRLHELFHDAPDVERLHGYPLVRLATDPTLRPSWLIKRVVDVLAASAALVVLSPVLGLCALAVLVESGRPLIFVQERVGLDGRPIRIFKLRSMRPADEDESQTRWTIAGDLRVGPVGRFLRRTSLDELPQLWNIARGDMSVVGPRPERPGFVAEFSATYDGYWARHRMRAGLTGLAQVNGLRGDTSIADRARYDNYYIANWSLRLDLKIVLQTVRELARRGDH